MGLDVIHGGAFGRVVEALHVIRGVGNVIEVCDIRDDVVNHSDVVRGAVDHGVAHAITLSITEHIDVGEGGGAFGSVDRFLAVVQVIDKAGGPNDRRVRSPAFAVYGDVKVTVAFPVTQEKGFAGVVVISEKIAGEI